jgi:hypothetical protein
MQRTWGDSMSGKPEDIRPRVISFPPSLDGLNIAAKKDILWPCHAFTVSIPHKRKHVLNIFEETILKLTWIEAGDANKIADITCLDKELVSFIQNRLYHMELVDNRRNITKKGQVLLEKWNNDSEENVEYAAVTVFVDLLNGNLLPYIHTGCLKHQNIRRIDEKFIEVNLGTTGKPKHVTCRRIRPGKSSFWNFIPNSKDIVKTVREFRKKYNRYVFMTKGIRQAPPPLQIADAITVHDKPELIYLHCVALIQVGNSALLVTDGVGFGFSESFARYLVKQKWQWVADIKKQGIEERIQSNNEKNENSRDITWRFREVTQRFRAPDNGIDRLLNDLGCSPDTAAKEEEHLYKRHQVVSRLYEALEWALRYVISDYNVPEWKLIFVSQNYRENETLLREFARKIGFSVSKTNQSILQVKPGAIRQIEHGKVELQPLLAIAIAGAATKYPDHPFHALAYSHAGFLHFVLQLKKLRDSVAHGDITDFKEDYKQLKEMSDRLIEIIVILLPEIARELEREDVDFANTNDDDVNQKRLKAEVKIENTLGLPFVAEMSSDIKEQLIRSEIMLEHLTGANMIEIIKCYASALQLALFEVVKNRKLPAIKGVIKEIAIAKIVESGFYSSVADIPETIRTSNVKRLHYTTVYRKSTTLGVHLLTTFLLATDDELNSFKRREPEFIELVDNIISLRGHGNEYRHSFSRIDMEKLRDKVFKAIKIIAEVFDE